MWWIPLAWSQTFTAVPAPSGQVYLQVVEGISAIDVRAREVASSSTIVSLSWSDDEVVRQNRSNDQTVDDAAIRWERSSVLPNLSLADEIARTHSFDAAAVRWTTPNPLLSMASGVNPGDRWTEDVAVLVELPDREGRQQHQLTGTAAVHFVGWTSHEGSKVAEFERTVLLAMAGATNPHRPGERPAVVFTTVERVLLDPDDALPQWVGRRSRLTSAFGGWDPGPDVYTLESVSDRL